MEKDLKDIKKRLNWIVILLIILILQAEFGLIWIMGIPILVILYHMFMERYGKGGTDHE